MSQMIRVTLPDGSAREVARGTTPAQIAADIGPGLAKAALAIEVGGKMRIAPGRSLTYGRGSSQQAYAATSAVVGAMRTMAAEVASPAAVRSAGFSEHDRESAG